MQFQFLFLTVYYPIIRTGVFLDKHSYQDPIQAIMVSFIVQISTNYIQKHRGGDLLVLIMEMSNYGIIYCYLVVINSNYCGWVFLMM
jgi:hypothetical protein